MVLVQGVLKPGGPVAGRQVMTRRPNTTKEGLGIGQLQRLIQTGKPNICIVRSLGGIGDVLMTTPMLGGLKHQWPDCHITYATDFKYMDGALRDVLLYNPHIDELVQYQAAFSKDFDYKVDITSVCIGHETPGTQNVPNRIDLFANHVGVSLDESGHLPTYIISEDEKKWAQQKLNRYPRKNSNSPRIGIQVRSSTVSRSWPLENVRELAMRLVREIGAQVVIFDSSHGHGPQESWNMPGIICFKDYKIRQVAAIIDEMDLMVTPDSSLLHISGALNKRVVSIWAGSDPRSRINYYPNTMAVVKDSYACFPCWYSPTACSKTYLCIKSITVDEVYDAVTTQLLSPTNNCQGVHHDTTYIRRDVGGYGDIICLTSAVNQYAQQRSDKKIVVAVPKQYHCIFENNPHVHSCIDVLKDSIPLGARVYNMTNIDAQVEVQSLQTTGSVQSTRPQIYIDHMCQDKPQTDDAYVPKLYITDEEVLWARRRFMADSEFTYIVTTLSTAEPYRTWPLDKYQELFDIVGKEHPSWRFIVCGESRLDWIPSDNIIDAGGFPFRRSMCVVSAADMVLTPDTSLLHVAAAFDKPCVALFGPIDSKARCKYYSNTEVLTADRICMPCWRNSTIPCVYSGSLDESFCMTEISPKQVLSALEEKCLILKQ